MTRQDYHKKRISADRKVGVINLGCARNLVDAQLMLGNLKKNGQRIVGINEAQTVIVNTCSFIEDARKESIDTILDLIEQKKRGQIKKVIVAGCLAQRYGKNLAREFPEVDAFVGTPTLNREELPSPVQLSLKHFAYVKICEGCFNACAFCAIPQIKGKLTSRRIESVVKEVSLLDAQGVKEINIIGQDITAFGMDIYHRTSLARLLKELVVVCKNIEWIRLLYTFPSHVSDELLEVIAQEPKICKYIDVPLQHISDHILQEQNRHITTAQTRALIQKIRKVTPRAFLRTSFITGLPGETQDDFEQLRLFMKDSRFERVGVFVYSKEEGTPAAKMKGQVSSKIKKARRDILMQDQQVISREIQQSLVGRKLKVLIEKEEKKGPHTLLSKSSVGAELVSARSIGRTQGPPLCYIGRSEYDAPDVDGAVYVHSKLPLKSGDFVEALITDAYEYDLAGVV